jgi:outer membrane receptor protein involved in Fe transport
MGTVGAAEYYDNRPLNQQPTGIPVFGTTSSVGIENTTGNVNLTEEQADTFTLGVVMDFLENWTLTVDYWTVEVTDMIAVEPPDDVYERCLSLASNPGADPTTEGCLSIVRNPSTGAGAQIDLSYSNQGRAEFSGVDLSLNWSKPLAVGGLGLTVFGSYNLESKTQSAAESPTIEWAGTQGCALQMDCQQYDYRIFTTLNYFRGAWGVTLRHQFWPEILSSQCSSIAIPAACAISTGGVRENYQLFALSGSYQFRDKYTLRMGIENLLDEEPPLTGGNPNGVPYARPPTHVGGFGPGIGTYDPLGRRGFVSMTMNF